MCFFKRRGLRLVYLLCCSQAIINTVMCVYTWVQILDGEIAIVAGALEVESAVGLPHLRSAHGVSTLRPAAAAVTGNQSFAMPSLCAYIIAGNSMSCFLMFQNILLCFAYQDIVPRFQSHHLRSSKG